MQCGRHVVASAGKHERNLTFMSVTEVWVKDTRPPTPDGETTAWRRNGTPKEVLSVQCGRHIMILLHYIITSKECECVASCDFSTRPVQAISDEQCRPSSKISKKTCKRRTNCKFYNIYSIYYLFTIYHNIHI